MQGLLQKSPRCKRPKTKVAQLRALGGETMQLIKIYSILPTLFSFYLMTNIGLIKLYGL